MRPEPAITRPHRTARDDDTHAPARPSRHSRRRASVPGSLAWRPWVLTPRKRGNTARMWNPRERDSRFGWGPRPLQAQKPEARRQGEAGEMNENGEGGRTTAPHGLEASVLARLRAATRDGPREAQITDEGGGQRSPRGREASEEERVKTRERRRWNGNKAGLTARQALSVSLYATFLESDNESKRMSRSVAGIASVGDWAAVRVLRVPKVSLYRGASGNLLVRTGRVVWPDTFGDVYDEESVERKKRMREIWVEGRSGMVVGIKLRMLIGRGTKLNSITRTHRWASSCLGNPADNTRSSAGIRLISAVSSNLAIAYFLMKAAISLVTD
ncbi:hypothetical protein B0H16DRAFT_1758804 [Mycena metata]|uniref:Uncharacterized protein n=1 Tax=Mycena metata TaxID=1033252 RepID=A0AAD7IDI6_9AGAR|nr:hypothetical protein B0H16DRAFT_1758804 [Mycena metata]